MSNTIKQKYIALMTVVLFSSSLTHVQKYICDRGVSTVMRGTVKFVTALGLFTALNTATVTNAEHIPLTLNQNHVSSCAKLDAITICIHTCSTVSPLYVSP